MKRTVEPEILDALPPEDPRATGSRRDLERINWWMSNVGKLASALGAAFNGSAPKTILELGAGDGRLMLQVASRLAPSWKGVRVLLLDRVGIVQTETVRAFKDLGWEIENVQADVFEWLRRESSANWSAIIANLFLHHFVDEELQELLKLAARRTEVFVAAEPPRGKWPLAFCGLLGLIGCNRVTRHDAAISVRAGFIGQEISQLWPADGNWTLQEGRSGIFSHVFLAQKARRPEKRTAVMQHGSHDPSQV